MKIAIPTGYVLKISSWENAGDHNMTKELTGLDEDTLLFYIDIAKQFKGSLGNDGNSNEVLLEVFDNTCNRHLVAATQFRDIDEDNIHEWLMTNILGSPVEEGYWDMGNFCRAVDGYQVQYVHEPIEDVTDKYT